MLTAVLMSSLAVPHGMSFHSSIVNPEVVDAFAKHTKSKMVIIARCFSQASIMEVTLHSEGVLRHSLTVPNLPISRSGLVLRSRKPTADSCPDVIVPRRPQAGGAGVLPAHCFSSEQGGKKPVFDPHI